MKTYQYDSINFVAATVASQSVTNFCESNKGNYFLNESEDVRIEKLCEIHEACSKLVEKHIDPVVEPVDNTPEIEHKEQ